MSDAPPPPLLPPPPAEAPHAPPSPRALRTMALVRWLLLALVTAVAAYSVWTHWGPRREGHAAHGPDRYYCPMHPQVRASEPGTCPICHMRLELIPEDRLKAEATPDPARSAAPHPADVTAVTIPLAQQKAVGISTTLVARGTIRDRLRVPGVVTTPESSLAQAHVRAAGFVESVAVRQTGVRVRRGQPLAYVYSPEIYRAQEEFLAAHRWSSPGADGGAGAAGAEVTSAARRGLELLGLTKGDIDEVVRTGKPIRAIAVRAPASGYVTKTNAILGARAEPDLVLYEIADLSTVWIVASVNERDRNSVHVGLSARFSLPGATGAPIVADVSLVEPLLEEATRTARLRLVVKNPDGALKPGQFGEVEFELPSSSGLFVPRDAVIHTGEHEYVYVAGGDDRFEPRLVQTGVSRDGRVQILSGVVEGDRVVTRGGFMLDSESRLTASLSGAAASASAQPAASAPVRP